MRADVEVTSAANAALHVLCTRAAQLELTCFLLFWNHSPFDALCHKLGILFVGLDASLSHHNAHVICQHCAPSQVKLLHAKPVLIWWVLSTVEAAV